MANSNTACPVCTLFLREGVTLQAHLDTHPKEQVIQALLRVANGGTSESSSAQKSPTLASSGSAFTPVQPGLNSNSLWSQSPHALLSINPQSQMTTAVTYQHFMTSNGSTALPQFIQVPTLVNPSSNIPVFSNPANLVPNSTVNYSQTAYNPLYNPYIPQPYPFTQSVFTGYPLTSFSSSSSETQNFNLNLSSSQPETAAQENALVKKSTVATSTEAKVKSVKARSKKTSLKHAANRRKVKVLKQKLCESNRLLWKIRSRFAPIKPALVKVMKQKFAAASRTNARMISPPPLTLITGATNNAITGTSTPAPPPLSKAPCFEIINVDRDEDVTDSAPPNHRTDNHEIDFLGLHSKSKGVSDDSESVVLCSNTELKEDLKEQGEEVITILSESNESKDLEDEAHIGCPRDPLDTREVVKGGSESDEEEMEEEQEKVFEMLEVSEESKVDVSLTPLNHDIPKQIRSENIERNCDGSDIFIQEENIVLNEHSDKEKTNDNLYSDYVQVQVVEPVKEQPEVEKNEREFGSFSREEGEGVEYASKKQPSSQVTYTDLQPAKSSKVFQDLGISPYLNFNNYMEVDGIKIFFNNSSSNLPMDPIIKKVTSIQNGKSLSPVMKCENQKTNHTIVDSVIQNASAETESKADVAFRESFRATTSQTNDVQLDLADMSPLALNIQADESMPARGELSEQESLGAENSSWNLFRGSSMSDARTLEEWRNDRLSVSVIGDKQPAKSFTCSTCNEVFSCPKERRVHKNTVHLNKAEKGEKVLSCRKQKSYACSVCGDVFGSLKDRRVHIYQIHQSESKEKRSEIKEENAEPSNNEETTVKNEAMQENSVKDEEAPPLSETNNETVKYCLRCSLPFAGVKKMREHMRLAHGEARFKCETCSAGFDEESEYNEHLMVHPLTCNKCGKTFHKRPNLKLHMKRHLEVKPYECSLCPKSFITRQKLEEHMNSHSGKKPIKCNLCDKTFSRHSNLIQHKNMHHLNVKRKTKDFVCRCGEVFHSLRKLEWHKEVHEPRPKPCPYCSQKFIHSASVTRHIRRAHLPEYLPGDNREFDNVQCPICEKVYLRSSLVVHMRVHNGEKPFACKICDKRFSTKWNLELHNWTHQSRSNMPFKCTVCKSAFFRESDFVAHTNSHRNYKPFTCNVCGQKFIRKYSCLRHQEEHKKSKQYVCGVSGCAKSFHRGYYLRDHMKVHTGVRPHTCHICGKASSTKSNHNKHVRIHDTREPVNTEN